MPAKVVVKMPVKLNAKDVKDIASLLVQVVVVKRLVQVADVKMHVKVVVKMLVKVVLVKILVQVEDAKRLVQVVVVKYAKVVVVKLFVLAIVKVKVLDVQFTNINLIKTIEEN